MEPLPEQHSVQVGVDVDISGGTLDVAGDGVEDEHVDVHVEAHIEPAFRMEGASTVVENIRSVARHRANS